MDLDKLRIDRGDETHPGAPAPRGPQRSRLRLAPIFWLALLIGAGWLFKKPLMGVVDGLRLTKVRVAEAYEPDPMSGGAISGVAANGYIVARNRAALSADTPGRITEINVEEGSVVKKGDVVARLYAAEYEAAVQAARADLELAQAGVTTAQERVLSSTRNIEAREADLRGAEARVRGAKADQEFSELDLERNRNLVARDVSSQRSLDQAIASERAARAELEARNATVEAASATLLEVQAQAREAEAALKEAEAQVPLKEALLAQSLATLDKTIVRAPFDGIVVLKDAEVGEVVSPNSQGGSSRGSVATMVDFSSLEVQVELPETSLGAAKIGATAKAWLDAFPDRSYVCNVQRIWPTANRQKATIEVRLVFLKPDQRLRPEMGVRVVFVADSEPLENQQDTNTLEGVLVPKNALTRIEGKQGLFVLERDVARWRTPQIANQRDSQVQILAGLAAGERVVVAPPPSLQDGDRVIVEEN